jgi:hypothetical protein
VTLFDLLKHEINSFFGGIDSMPDVIQTLEEVKN